MSFFSIPKNIQDAVNKLRLPRFKKMRINEQDYLLKVFGNQDHCKADPGLKLRLYETLITLMIENRKSFGFLMILGWDRKWNQEFMSIPDVSQNIFTNRPFAVLKHSTPELVAKLDRTIDFDGAVLVSRRGKILASGVYLENMKPKQVIEKMGVTRYEDLSQAFGFGHKVHTRHLAGIAASYWLKNTLVYVISEEDRTLRVFENGKILYSPYPKEIAWNCQ